MNGMFQNAQFIAIDAEGRFFKIDNVQREIKNPTEILKAYFSSAYVIHPVELVDDTLIPMPEGQKIVSIVHKAGTNKERVMAMNIPFINIHTYFGEQVIDEKTIQFPTYSEQYREINESGTLVGELKDSVRKQLKWYAPEGCRFYFVVHENIGESGVTCYLIFVDEEKGDIYLPLLSNVFDCGKICIGDGLKTSEYVDFTSKFIDAFQDFYRSLWDTDLSREAVKVRQLIRFDENGKTLAPIGSWQTICRSKISNVTYNWVIEIIKIEKEIQKKYK